MMLLAKILSFIAIVFYGQSSFAQSGAIAPRPVIIELFTSQGCSSCPTADKVLKYFVDNNPNVIALSMHVDYWNYIGWADPFSSAQITQRQKQYSAAMGRNNIYTPQMVIDGKYQESGSHYNKILPLVGEALSGAKDVPVSVDAVDNKLQVGITPHSSQAQENADIVVIGYDNEKTTKVTRGENSGEEITNANIVQYIKTIGTYNGEKVSIEGEIPKTDNVIVILQNAGQKEIIGVGIL